LAGSRAEKDGVEDESRDVGGAEGVRIYSWLSDEQGSGIARRKLEPQCTCIWSLSCQMYLP